ncbi:uncharacterized protein LOC129734019 [Wyeomyia smithii]|uniref:uncharacterized protein LOC129734019 n=1 Tax=Wyeomyia smithii TaxID=174621 RepID=UPI002467B176|nr:uncharacterized protein LOC129734019 [Wyeomyia smithii]
MKRKLNTLELRRLKEHGQSQKSAHQDGKDEGISQKKRTTLRGSRSKSFGGFVNGGRGLARREDPREHQELGRDEIALMFMEVSEKIDRCFDFDLQKWLNRYESLSHNSTNFPEAAMLIMSAAQIYGRKVDYLEDIILHMDQDQKGREDVEGAVEQKQEKVPGGRKRAARFQPQTVSDCFSDLEFSFVDRKLASVDTLVGTLQRMGVDKRNKFQQMQELCIELRTMPTKQRRQEILHRLRDVANIPPIMSSHTAARKRQILDLESGETIGTRYDYQTFLNFIDVKTGSLTPEHDLKKFFQRCDVIDYLYEQQECERKRCERSGKPAPDMVFPLKPREFKMYIPPDYLRNKYRIQMNDTTDFDNELHQAKSSNYQSDPILDLMRSKFATRSSEPKKSAEVSSDEPSFCNVLSSSAIYTEIPDATTEDQEYEDLGGCEPSEDITEAIEPSSSEEMSVEVSGNSMTETNSTDQEQKIDETLQTSHETSQSKESESSSEEGSLRQPSEIIRSNLSKESTPEPELMALEIQTETRAQIITEQETPSTGCPSRLSYEDEGIGADRDTPPDQHSPACFSRTPSLDVLSDCAGSISKTLERVPFFGGGTVIATDVRCGGSVRTILIKPALVKLNMLKIPECHLKKHLLFSLPIEYKKMKNDLVRKSKNLDKETFTLAVYSLNPQASKNSEWTKRPVTPEPEDFYGFDDRNDVLDNTPDNLYSLASTNDQHRNDWSRPSTPESDFYGFDDFDFDEARKKEKKRKEIHPCETVQKNELPKLSEVKPTAEVVQANLEESQASETPNSQQSTPNRTLSRDSGISDDQTDRRGSRSKEATPEPIDVSQKISTTATTAVLTAEPQSVLNSEKYIQSVTEAKELIEKVNNWHRKLKPILIQSEQRNHFDIHAYGSEIIESFVQVEANNSVSNISFAQIMDNKQQDYTARYFLSMLMLANTNNVQILTRNQHPNRLTNKEDIELRLLSRQRHHQEMESMGERIPCDNTLSGKVAKMGRTSRGNKRKLENESVASMDNHLGSRRLQDNDESEYDFLEKMQRLYPDINGEETMRKRMAFQRGMRRCAYGLVTETREEGSIEIPLDHISQQEHETDEILSVDLLTNETMMVPMMLDQGPCCSKSISISESGYGSMLGEGDR